MLIILDRKFLQVLKSKNSIIIFCFNLNIGELYVMFQYDLKKSKGLNISLSQEIIQFFFIF